MAPINKEESDDALTQYVLSPAANFFRLLNDLRLHCSVVDYSVVNGAV